MFINELNLIKLICAKSVIHIDLKKMTKGMSESLQRDQTDAIDSYFECVTACSLDNDGVECVTRCVEVHLKSEE